MAKGFPGMGGGNMNNLLKQAQKMQKDMEKNKKELEANARKKGPKGKTAAKKAA